MPCDSLPLFPSHPPITVCESGAKRQAAQTVGHIILALSGSRAELGEQSGGPAGTCLACSRDVAQRHISPPPSKALVNMIRQLQRSTKDPCP